MKRWIIRGLFLWLLLLCLTGWAWSLWYDTAFIYYWRPDRTVPYDRAIACFSVSGFLVVGKGGGMTEFGQRDGWEYRRIEAGEWSGPSIWKVHRWWNDNSGPHSLGTDALTHSLSIPYWLPTLIFSACLYLSCRKARPINPATAFPIEVATQGKRSSKNPI